MMAAGGAAGGLEWAATGRALDGEASGDLHLVLPGSPESLVCVMDGLGHGPEAQAASEECAAILKSRFGAPLLDLVHAAHEGLRGTRGVALTLALVDEQRGRLEWVAIGNVEGLVLRQGLPRGPMHGAVVQRGGVVGYRLPPLKVSEATLAAGDVLVFATDGIKSGFSTALELTLGVRELADDIASRFDKRSDDSLVLVARYLGGAR
ncbi:MAG TPA: SpoIIE family protein phosphatase [Polyangiaceae bacterium]|nr:SpoIIE family protein phosphatase [Polyangiaceae bacterium]